MTTGDAEEFPPHYGTKPGEASRAVSDGFRDFRVSIPELVAGIGPFTYYRAGYERAEADILKELIIVIKQALPMTMRNEHPHPLRAVLSEFETRLSKVNAPR